MLIYNYASDSGEFVGESTAPLDPLELANGNEVYLIPANATTTPPPNSIAGTAPVFAGGSWSLVADLRRTPYWTFEGNSPTKHIVDDLWEIIPEGAVLSDPGPRPSQYHEWGGSGWVYVAPAPTPELVTQERDRRIASPKTFALTNYGNVTIAGDAATITNLDSLALKATVLVGQGATNTVTNYRDANNVVHTLTQDKVLDLWSQGGAYIQAVYEASWTLKDMDPIPEDYTSDTHWP